MNVELLHGKSIENGTNEITRLSALGELTTQQLHQGHTPSIALRHLPPNSARTGYAIRKSMLGVCFPVTESAGDGFILY